MGKIVLRDIGAEDLEAICEMEADIRVREFIGGVKTREQSEKGLRFGLAHKGARWAPQAVSLQGHAKMIGYCGLQPLDKDEPQRIEVFYGLNSDYWGHGYATQAVKLKLAEAFATGIETVYARIDGNNKRSIALIVKLGFEIEGERYSPELKKNEILFSLGKPEARTD